MTVYIPIDEHPNRATVRVLRALRRFDWAEPIEIRAALDGDTSQSVSDAFGKLLRQRLIERRYVVINFDYAGRPLRGPEYRITQAGRDHLARIFTVEAPCT